MCVIFMQKWGGEVVVKVQITESGIQMDGHAGHFKDGRDIVCAAISALTCNLINSMQELAGVEILTEKCESGFVSVEWKELSKEGRLLVDSWFLGIAAINQEYRCIEFV